MNKLVIDGIDYTDIKKKFYQLSKQTLCDDLIKKIYEYGKLERALNEIKEIVKGYMPTNQSVCKAMDEIEEIIDKVGGNE